MQLTEHIRSTDIYKTENKASKQERPCVYVYIYVSTKRIIQRMATKQLSMKYNWLMRT